MTALPLMSATDSVSTTLASSFRTSYASARRSLRHARESRLLEMAVIAVRASTRPLVEGAAPCVYLASALGRLHG